MKANSAIANIKASDTKGFSPNIGIWLFVFFLLMFGTFAATGLDPYNNTTANFIPPASLQVQKLHWVFNYFIPGLGAIMAISFLVISIKKRTFTWWFLFSIAAMCMFPLESMADWGANLTYNPAFPHFNFPFAFPWHVAHNPYFLIGAYIQYWGMHAYLAGRGANWLSRKTNWPVWVSAIVLGIPTGYIWNIMNEGVATYMGWWQYQPAIGPSISWAKFGGLGNFPLTIPVIIACLWPTFMSVFVDNSGQTTYQLGRIEKLFNLGRLLPDNHPSSPNYKGDPNAKPTKFAWKFEIAKLVSWIGIFLWTYFFLMDVPCVLAKYFTQKDSPIWHPWPTLVEGLNHISRSSIVLGLITIVLVVVVFVVESRRRKVSDINN